MPRSLKIHRWGERPTVETRFLKSKLTLAVHLLQEISWGKALGSNLAEDTWAGEARNVEKPAGAHRAREASENIHQPGEKEQGIDMRTTTEREKTAGKPPGA